MLLQGVGGKGIARLPAAHAGDCCRCFLPDLTGFTGRRRAGPGYLLLKAVGSTPDPFLYLAERAGFEPAVHLWGRTHDFQSCSFSRSDISPYSPDEKRGHYREAPGGCQGIKNRTDFSCFFKLTGIVNSRYPPSGRHPEGLFSSPGSHGFLGKDKGNGISDKESAWISSIWPHSSGASRIN